ncbi:glycosyltransferase family 2 protein [Hyphococcus flavus]|uniref:Glycosyltransferase family 2 protein n=1 Tax=Hyphococcus flavus TaxID=1866326 RepID=A0AAE9ZDE9_9PROT|nr:glycosyltransferase family 2 protein [Hyphococcus flavus]WDI32491.1 glycosyltransferase family 2 protein [Hyphococcus flavus]
MHPKVSVIIVNYNSGPRLEKCVAHLRAQTFSDFEILVVDNASADGSADFTQTDGAITLIKAEGNIGFAAANNLASYRAQGEWLAFLNPDAYADPDWLKELISAIARHPQAEAFGSTQLDDADKTRIDGAGDVFHAFGIPYRGLYGRRAELVPEEGECFAPCAAAAIYRKSTFKSLGGFNERFFCYIEDVDLGFRLRLAGGMSIQVPAAIVRHEGSALTGRSSDFTIYHGHRNRIWTYFLNMPLPLLIATAPFHYFANTYFAFRFLLIGKGTAYFRALRDAHRDLRETFAARRKRQLTRKAKTCEIARALTWSPFKVMTRNADIRQRRRA